MKESVMLSFGPPWKLALIGVVSLVAGSAFLFAHWQLSELAAFVAMYLVARGALHLVTTSFAGVSGALSALQGGIEIAAGILLLAWPDPTLLVLTVTVGALVLVEGTVDAAVVLTTRDDVPHWPLRITADLLENALAIVLIARPAGTVHATAITLGAIAILAGTTEIATAIQRSRQPTNQHTAATTIATAT
jgi:uncharacterized membrane protein HdeD (DUF308 family)